MSERLAKKKAEQEAAAQAKANQALRFGVTNPPAVKKDKPWYEDIGSAIGGAIKSVYENIPMSNPISTPINMGGDAGVSIGGQGTVKSLVTEPARLAVRRAVGDITAIPRVGEPSPSYTADQIREQGVARGVLGAAIDYSQFIPVVAKGAGFTGDAVNAYKLAMMERQANPFPALRGASNVIDVVPGSRLPARIVEAPATPATRLAEAQTQRELTSAATQGMTIDELNQFARTINADKQIMRADTNALPEFWGGEPMINDRLRGDYLQNEFDTQIANAKEFFQNIPALERPVKVFRGIVVEEPSAGVNAFSNFVRTWKVGDVIEEPGFMSTTIDRDMAEGFANDGIVIEIDIPKGAKVATPTMFGDIYQSIENELTLPPNSKYQIMEIDGKNIKAKIVPAETKTTNFQTTRDQLLRYTEDPRTPATRLGNAMAQMTLDARAAQGGVRDAGVIRFPGGEPTPEIVQPPESKALLQRLQARNNLGVTVRDIEFPPKDAQKEDWFELGNLQYEAGINPDQLPKHIEAVSKYFDEQYMDFHDYLRTDTINTETIENDVALIDQLFDIVPPVTSPITLYRGVISDEWIGNVYKNLKPGQIVYDPNYLSTSVSRIMARDWINNLPDNHLLVIDVTPGTKAINSMVAGTFYGRSEQEMLLPRSLPLRVKSIDGNEIRLETLPYEYIDNAKDLSDLFNHKH